MDGRAAWVLHQAEQETGVLWEGKMKLPKKKMCLSEKNFCRVQQWAEQWAEMRQSVTDF